MLLMIDNYDSFTYNLVQYLGELGAGVETVRNDAVSVEEIEGMAPSGIVISPGPCTPNCWRARRYSPASPSPTKIPHTANETVKK